MVFCDFYPGGKTQYEELRDAMDRLQLNDSSFTFAPESSDALGFGFRCGFLGLLHIEIIQERLEREFNLDLITTAPSVRYKITKTDGTLIEVENPSRWPDPSEIEKIEEPVILATILTGEEYVGGILALVEEKRGVQKTFEYLSSTHVMLHYELPLNEIVLDFYDRLKSVSRGYASLDYHLAGTGNSPMVKMDILVGGDPVDALSIIVHRDFAYERGHALVSKMRELIPRQMFEVAIQAAIGGKIIARETVARYPQERTCEVLRRRYLPQAQAARKAKRRQEAHEAYRPRRHSPGSLSRRPQSRGKQRLKRSLHPEFAAFFQARVGILQGQPLLLNFRSCPLRCVNLAGCIQFQLVIVNLLLT